jgi:hypothetical protein
LPNGLNDKMGNSFDENIATVNLRFQHPRRQEENYRELMGLPIAYMRYLNNLRAIFERDVAILFSICLDRKQ